MYQYTYRFRGFSIGCQPMQGLIEHKDVDGYKYGILYYNRQLSQVEIDNYELIDLNAENKQICMQCKREFEKNDLFWINDYQGIPYKKVCSLDCENEAINDLDEAKESWGYGEYDVVDY